jgi:hypothetical protein
MKKPLSPHPGDSITVLIKIIDEDGAKSEKSYKVVKHAQFSAVRSALKTNLNVQSVVLSEHGSEASVDYDQALDEARSYSPNRSPSLVLSATVSTSEPSDVYKHIQVARILHRNAQECLQAAENGTKPSNRKRHNSAISQISEKRPRVETFVRDTRALATSLKTFADTMSKMSEELDSATMPDAELRTLVDNTMDAGRYFIPVLQSLTKLALPKSSLALQEELILETVAPTARPRHHVVKGKAADAVDKLRTVL